MNNRHIIVGSDNKCACGVYDGKEITCGDILTSLRLLMMHANKRTSAVSVYLSDIAVIDTVIQSLIKEKL